MLMEKQSAQKFNVNGESMFKWTAKELLGAPSGRVEPRVGPCRLHKMP